MNVLTKQMRIAEHAKESPEMVFTSLNHYLDLEWLIRAWEKTRKSGATGVDGVTAQEYERSLESNLLDLLSRLKSGTYRAPPVKRGYIPKPDGTNRAIGIPTLEDKIAQRAVVMLLEPIYEQDFKSFSYGFRPGRSAHQALDATRDGVMKFKAMWVIEADIRKFFDNVDHEELRLILDKRIKDGVIRRLIGKWLKAGVMEENEYSRSEQGTPQGGVLSPLLSNIFLHEVLDKWFEEQVRARTKGRCFLVRYADDFIAGFERRDDAERVFEVLPKRFTKYGLSLHPDKTQIVDYHPLNIAKPDGGGGGAQRSFSFLGFVHTWGRSRRGNWVVRQFTDKQRFARALVQINSWCRLNRHKPVAVQHDELSAKVLGHYGYYGIRCNWKRLSMFVHEVERIWKKWLSRRSWKSTFDWAQFKRLLKRYTLPAPRLAKAYRTDRLGQTQIVKNRMP